MDNSNPSVNEPTEKSAAYQTNPILIAIDGIERLFKYAKPMALSLLVISFLLGFSNLVQRDITTGDINRSYSMQSDVVGFDFSNVDVAVAAAVGVFVLIILIGFTLLGIFLSGLMDYTAAAAAQNRTVSLREAFAGVFKRFWPYVWLRILTGLKTLLWTLLFILPGIYFTYRYYLSGVAFFADDKRGSAAIKESLRLTKGAWLTTFMSYSFFNLITLGLLQLVTQTGTSAELYRNYKQTVDAGQPHPKAHWLSWVLAIFLLLIFLLLVLVIVVVISNLPTTLPDSAPVLTT